MLAAQIASSLANDTGDEWSDIGLHMTEEPGNAVFDLASDLWRRSTT